MPPKKQKNSAPKPTRASKAVSKSSRKHPQDEDFEIELLTNHVAKKQARATGNNKPTAGPSKVQIIVSTQSQTMNQKAQNLPKTSNLAKERDSSISTELASQLTNRNQVSIPYVPVVRIKLGEEDKYHFVFDAATLRRSSTWFAKEILAALGDPQSMLKKDNDLHKQPIVALFELKWHDEKEIWVLYRKPTTKANKTIEATWNTQIIEGNGHSFGSNIQASSAKLNNSENLKKPEVIELIRFEDSIVLAESMRLSEPVKSEKPEKFDEALNLTEPMEVDDNTKLNNSETVDEPKKSDNPTQLDEAITLNEPITLDKMVDLNQLIKPEGSMKAEELVKVDDLTMLDEPKLGDSGKSNESTKIDDSTKLSEFITSDNSMDLDQLVKSQDSIKVAESMEVEVSKMLDAPLKLDESKKLEESMKLEESVMVDDLMKIENPGKLEEPKLTESKLNELVDLECLNNTETTISERHITQETNTTTDPVVAKLPQTTSRVELLPKQQLIRVIPQSACDSHRDFLLILMHNHYPKLKNDASGTIFSKTFSILQLTIHYDAQLSVQQFLRSSFLDAGKELYIAIKNDPATWLGYGWELQSSAIFKEAVVHLVGSDYKPGDEIPEDFRRLIAKKSQDLKNLEMKVKLDLCQHIIDIYGSKLELADKDSNKIRSWCVLHLWRDWFIDSFARLQHPSESGSIYRTIAEGGDAYLTLEQTLFLLGNRHPEDSKQWRSVDIAIDLQKMKNYAKQRVRELVVNNTMVDIKEMGIQYFTCTTLQDKEARWWK